MSQQPSQVLPHAQNPSGHSPAHTAQRTDVKSATHADIAKRAYQKYEARGRANGHDREDWAAATREFQAETSKH